MAANEENNNSDEKDPKGTLPADGSGDNAENDGADVEEDEEDPEEVAEREDAIKLFRALKDPEKGRKVLEILARDAGITLGEGTKKEQKNEIIEMLEESLGEGYTFLAPKLGPVLERLLKAQGDKFDQKLGEFRENDEKQKNDIAIDELLKEEKDFKIHAKRVASLMDELAPAKGQSQKSYLKKLLIIARGEAKAVTPGRDERINRNRSDVSNRLAPVGGSDRTNNKGRSLPTLRESIAAAMNSIEQDSADN